MVVCGCACVCVCARVRVRVRVCVRARARARACVRACARVCGVWVRLCAGALMCRVVLFSDLGVLLFGRVSRR